MEFLYLVISCALLRKFCTNLPMLISKDFHFTERLVWNVENNVDVYDSYLMTKNHSFLR